MPSLFLPLRPRPVEANVTHQTSYRSRSYHHIVKHCVEFTFIDQNPIYHFGFSPYRNRRSFITVDRNSKSQFLITQKSYSSVDNIIQSYSSPYENNQVFLVCLDSEERKITFVSEEKTDTITFPQFEHIEEWYVFTDARDASGSKYAHVSINLGFAEFIHTMPSGYSRWLLDIDGIYNLRKSSSYFLPFKGGLSYPPAVLIYKR